MEFVPILELELGKNKTMNCKCGNIIPKQRIQLGYNTCVNCSEEKPKGYVDIIVHKTGNSLEILDYDDAKKMEKLSKRRGFGSYSSLSGSSSNSKKLSGTGAFTGKYGLDLFNEVCETALIFLEEFSSKKATEYVEKKYKELTISEYSRNRIIEILKQFQKNNTFYVQKLDKEEWKHITTKKTLSEAILKAKELFVTSLNRTPTRVINIDNEQLFPHEKH